MKILSAGSLRFFLAKVGAGAGDEAGVKGGSDSEVDEGVVNDELWSLFSEIRPGAMTGAGTPVSCKSFV